MSSCLLSLLIKFYAKPPCNKKKNHCQRYHHFDKRKQWPSHFYFRFNISELLVAEKIFSELHKGLVSLAIKEHSKLTIAHGIVFQRVYPKHV